MSFPTILPLCKCDQVIMDSFFSYGLDPDTLRSLNRCRGAMETIFLSNIITADGRYLKHFVFDPGTKTAGSLYSFPRERPTMRDWDQWINFWNEYASTGGNLRFL
jgi:hypothetical protein